VGGRSLFWARQSFRLSDFEFKAGDLEGTGQNWPISLADMDPYYSRVEEIFRVQGRKEGWPEFPDGNFVEPNYGPDSETIKRLAALGKERGMFTGWELHNIRIYAGGDPDLVFAELDGQGVVAQSGYQYRQKYIILFRVSDGRISHWREYLNPIPLQEAIASMQTGQVQSAHSRG